MGNFNAKYDAQIARARNTDIMSSGRAFKLNSGYSIPAVGLGTWVSGNQFNYH